MIDPKGVNIMSATAPTATPATTSFASTFFILMHPHRLKHGFVITSSKSCVLQMFHGPLLLIIDSRGDSEGGDGAGAQGQVRVDH